MATLASATPLVPDAPTAEDLLARARAMIPALQTRAKQCIADRNIPAETIAEMRAAGFFRILQPKIVVCLGRIAAQRMIRADFSVTKEHGTFIEKGGIWFMGTFHPAALLRQKQNKPDAFADFLALREKIGQVCEHTY